MSSKCHQHVITGFQAPLPPVWVEDCDWVFEGCGFVVWLDGWVLHGVGQGGQWGVHVG